MASIAITIRAADDRAERMVKNLHALDARKQSLVLVRAIKRGGKQAFTQVKRTLAREVGASYRKIPGEVREIPPNFGNLQYEVRARGGETNLGLFNAVQRKKGVSAAPWRKRRVHKGTFLRSGKVFVREGDPRYPIRMLWGPNIARELHRPYTVSAWDSAMPFILKRIEHELSRALAR